MGLAGRCGPTCHTKSCRIRVSYILSLLRLTLSCCATYQQWEERPSSLLVSRSAGCSSATLRLLQRVWRQQPVASTHVFWSSCRGRRCSRCRRWRCRRHRASGRSDLEVGSAAGTQQGSGLSNRVRSQPGQKEQAVKAEDTWYGGPVWHMLDWA